MNTVAIVGGGFSGTLAAVNLARLAKTPLRIVLINHGSPTGRGVAYGTRRPEHLLNVAARNMSALADQPNHFLDWLSTRHEFADMPESELREQFMPRRVYGDYVKGLLFTYSKPAGDAAARIECVDGEVLDIVPATPRTAVVVVGHPTIEADKVLLATGNPPPNDLPVAGGHFEHPRYLANPWEALENRLTDRREDVIILGAGLTMIDAFLTLTALDWQGTIVAVSRTGQLPLSHFKGIAYPDFLPAHPESLGLAALQTLVEEHCARLRAEGQNPAIVVDKLRPFTQRIWQKFTLQEKQQFCRQHRTRWNVTRHRIPQSVHEQLRAAQETGKLLLIDGNIKALEAAAAGDRIQVAVEKRGRGERTVLEAAWVLNCTGPQESYRNSKSILFQNLLGRGLAVPDELDMGIKAGTDFAVLDGGGYPSEFLYAIGPLLKGGLWETTAVPELRIQAHRVAETILSRLAGGPTPDWAEMWVDVLEYSI